MPIFFCFFQLLFVLLQSELKKTMLMKKVVILIIANLLVAQFAAAQSVFTSTVQAIGLPGISSNYYTPICKLDDNRSILYLKEDATTMYFCVVDYWDFFNPFIPTIPMSPPTITGYYTAIIHPTGYDDLTVNDIYYTGGLAFFCGSIVDVSSSETTSVVGYFDPNTIGPSGTTNIQYRILSSGTADAPTSLHRLVAYPVSGDYDIVAFGDDLHGYPATHDFTTTKIVEINSIISTPVCSVADMAYGVIFNSDIHTFQITEKQYIDDIFLTENHVVLTGHDWNYPNTTIPNVVNMHASYHYGAKGRVLADIGSPGHNYHLDGRWETNDTVIGAALDGDIFAMSYVYPDANQGMHTRIRIIDPSVPVVIYSAEFDKQQKENPVRMIYHDKLNALELLQPVLSPSDFIMVDLSVPLPFTAPALNPTSSRYRTMHGTHGNSFVSANEKFIYLQNRATALPPSTGGCPKDDYLDVFEIDPIDIDAIDVPRISSCNIDIDVSNSLNFPLPLTTSCFSFE